MRRSLLGLLLTAVLTSVIAAQGIVLCVEQDGRAALEHAVIGSCRESESITDASPTGLSDKCGDCVDHDLVGASLARKISKPSDLLRKVADIPFVVATVLFGTNRLETRRIVPPVHTQIAAEPHLLTLLRGVVLRC